MKKLILILLIIVGQGFVFGQEKNDSTKSKLKYAINFSIHSLGDVVLDLGAFWLQWQTDLSFDLIYKRHTWSTGITGGPGLALSLHAGPNDCLIYQQDYKRWGVYGINLSYQFQFNKLNRATKSSIIFYISYARYRNTHRLKSDYDYILYEKNLTRCLLGYSFKGNITKKFSIGFNILGGTRYYYDRHNHPNAPSFRKYYKWLADVMYEPNITYIF